MRTPASMFFVLTILVMSHFAAAQRVIDPPSAPQISTSGEATVWVTPDIVVVNLGVETFDPRPIASKNKNDDLSARLVEAIKALNVEPKDLQTTDIEFDIRYKNNMTEIEGYIARRMYSTKLRDIKQFEPLVSSALNNGANRLLGFEYQTTELRKFRDQARSMAIKAAKEKAIALAGELDCKVGKPRSISEGYFGYFGWSGSRWNYSSGYASNVSQNMSQTTASGNSDEIAPLGQIGVKATINVSFELE